LEFRKDEPFVLIQIRRSEKLTCLKSSLPESDGFLCRFHVRLVSLGGIMVA